MTTVIRPVSEHDGNRRGERIEEAYDELVARDHDTEWVVDIASNRVVRRDVPLPRVKR
jgi:hypothetical protein